MLYARQTQSSLLKVRFFQNYLTKFYFRFLLSLDQTKMITVCSTSKPVKTNADPAGDFFFLFLGRIAHCSILIGSIGLSWGLSRYLCGMKIREDLR